MSVGIGGYFLVVLCREVLHRRSKTYDAQRRAKEERVMNFRMKTLQLFIEVCQQHKEDVRSLAKTLTLLDEVESTRIFDCLGVLVYEAGDPTRNHGIRQLLRSKDGGVMLKRVRSGVFDSQRTMSTCSTSVDNNFTPLTSVASVVPPIAVGVPGSPTIAVEVPGSPTIAVEVPPRTAVEDEDCEKWKTGETTPNNRL